MPPKSTTKPHIPPTTPQWKGHKIASKILSTQERLKRLFTSLCAQIDGGHFGNAVKTCDKILRLEPNDLDARQTKLFLLLQTEQYNEALNLIDFDADQSQHSYERAYSLYRLQRESDARAILDKIKQENGENDRGVIHLEAQLSYREGSYDEAFELYNQLLDTAEPNSEEHSDILINLQASQRHVDFINRGFLQVLDALPTSITSTLETAPPPVQPTATVVPAAASANSSVEAQNAVLVQKKVRMKRVPAGVVPGVTPPPDPERWLKKSERSTFGHGRRRKGAGGGGGATQGSASLDAVPQASGAASKSGGNKSRKKK